MLQIQRKDCVNHAGVKATAKCLICGNEICSECREQFGYFCGKDCLEKSRQSVDFHSKENFAKTVQSSEAIIKIAKFAGIIISVIIASMIIFSAWGIFFSPLGKMAWEIKFDSPRNGGEIVEQNDSQITVKAGDEIFQIALQDGKILKKITLKDYKQSDKENEIVSDDKIISWRNKTLQCYNFSGELIWDKKFTKKVDSLYLAGNIILVSLNPSFDGDEDKKEKLSAMNAEIRAIDSSNGNEIWTKTIDGYLASNKIASSENICALSEIKYMNNKTQSTIKVFDSKSGIEKWQIKIDERINELIVSNKKLIFITEKKINAVQDNGEKKLWTISHSGFINIEDVILVENYSIIFDAKKIICVEDADGKIRWEKSFGSYIESKTLSDGRLFVISSKKEKEEKENSLEEQLPKRLEDLKDKNLLHESITAGKKSGKYVKVLSCIDISTGNEIWKQIGADGFLLSSGKELIKIYDTASATIMMLSPEAGETVITRYTHSNGNVIFEKRNKIGLTEPFVVAGNYLIAFEFIRGESGHSAKHISGIAAFKIK